MALYRLELLQNNEILNRVHHWPPYSSGFVIEMHVLRRNDLVSRATNRMIYRENRDLLSESGMRDFLIATLATEQMFLSSTRFLLDNGVQLIRDSQFGFPLPIPVLSVDYLVLSVLEMVRSMRNNPMNRFLTFVPIQLNLSIEEFRQVQFLDDSMVLDGESLGGRLQRLDDSVILEGRPLEVVVGLSQTAAVHVGLSQTAAVQLLKEEKVEASDTECSICLEGVGVGETVARMPCSHLFHRGCITRWLHKKPSCPLCRAPAC